MNIDIKQTGGKKYPDNRKRNLSAIRAFFV